MKKPADNRYPINELIAERWSPRAFGSQPVETEKLYQLFEAARWAPSSFNEQPWEFIVAPRQDVEAHAALAACLVEGNRLWAQKAPVLVMTVAKLSFARNDKPNRHAYYDLGQAVGIMMVQATDLGLVAHQMGGFDQDKARTTLQLPADRDPVAAMALGYPGDAETLPTNFQESEHAPRERRDVKQFLWLGTHGNPMPS